MSVEEISDYLQEALDVPLQYCKVFEGIIASQHAVYPNTTKNNFVY